MYLNAKNTFKIKLEHAKILWAGDDTLIPSTRLMDRVVLSAVPEARPVRTQSISIALLLAGIKRKKMTVVRVYFSCECLAVTLPGC